MSAANLAQMSDDHFAAWLEVYELGARDGWARGYAAAEADMDRAWRPAYDIVQQVARNPTFAELCGRRGEPERADAQRQLLRERGLA